ncbi:MAG: hypothetical protein AAB512_00130 [Patescibacteria group bacterium]
MPFKTKRRKIAAKNRIVFTESGVISYKVADHDEQVTVLGHSDAHKNVANRLTSEIDYKKLQSELTRIILLALFIIGLQLALKFSNIPLFK